MPAFTSFDVESLRKEISAFAAERDWDRFHTVRNLLLAVMSEVGECADIVRWAGDAADPVPQERAHEWEDELADVAILLIRLADRSGVDLPHAIQRKLAAARAKYPVDRFAGSSRKHDGRA